VAKYVKYIGLSHVRSISRDDWRKAGVNNQESLVWDRANGWTVPLSRITDEAWPFIDADSELLVVDHLRSDEPRPTEDPIVSEGDQITGAVAEAVQVNGDGEIVHVKQ
jgi:hypothetical protein